MILDRTGRWLGGASGSVVLLLCVLLIVVGAVVSAALAQISTAGVRAATGDTYAAQAVFAAEAGLEAASLALLRGGCSEATPPPLNSTNQFPGGQYVTATTYTSGAPLPWTIVATGYAPSLADPRGVRTLRVQGATCLDSPDPIVADPNALTIGPSFRILEEGETNNDTTATCTNNCLGSVVTEDGTYANRAYDFSNFPPWVGSSNNSGTTSINDSSSPVAAGDYNLITVTDDGPVTFSGGVYHINRLETTDSNTVVNFAPGTYYIKEFVFTNGGELVPTPLVSGQRINLHVKYMYLATNNRINWPTGGPGDPKNIAIWFHDDVSYPTNLFTTSGSQLISAILMGADGTFLDFSTGNTDIRGAVLSAGTLNFGSNTTIVYDNLAQSAATEIMASFGFIPMVAFANWRECYGVGGSPCP